jgi:hypothetical protein
VEEGPSVGQAWQPVPAGEETYAVSPWAASHSW